MCLFASFIDTNKQFSQFWLGTKIMNTWIRESAPNFQFKNCINSISIDIFFHLYSSKYSFPFSLFTHSTNKNKYKFWYTNTRTKKNGRHIQDWHVFFCEFNFCYIGWWCDYYLFVSQVPCMVVLYSFYTILIFIAQSLLVFVYECRINIWFWINLNFMFISISIYSSLSL